MQKRIFTIFQKIIIELWWILKRDSWVIAITSIMFGAYADAVPAQNLISFLEGRCFPYIIYLPLPFLAIIILSHICTYEQKTLKLKSSRRVIQVLYILGIISLLIAHVITIIVFAFMLFPKTHLMPSNTKLEMWHLIDEIYATVIVPFIDWLIFRLIIPRAFNDIKNIEKKESKYCHILNIPRKNLIASTLVFFILVSLLEIIC